MFINSLHFRFNYTQFDANPQASFHVHHNVLAARISQSFCSPYTAVLVVSSWKDFRKELSVRDSTLSFQFRRNSCPASCRRSWKSDRKIRARQRTSVIHYADSLRFRFFFMALPNMGIIYLVYYYPIVHYVAWLTITPLLLDIFKANLCLRSRRKY